MSATYEAKTIIHGNEPITEFIQNLLENTENHRAGIIKVTTILTLTIL